MRLFISILLAALMVSCATPPARSQSGFTVVSSCGTLPLAYQVGAVRTGTVDVNGNLCSVAAASGTSAINITQVAGAAVATGNGTAAGALRVALPTDGTGVVGLIAGSAIVGKVGIDQTTPGTTNAVTPLPTNAALTVDSKTVTNSSAAFLAASAATKYLFIKNESATASIALNFANGTAALNTAGNITLTPGQWQEFTTFIPTGAITAISSAASSPATVLRN